jgi:hypothetical protein
MDTRHKNSVDLDSLIVCTHVFTGAHGSRAAFSDWYPVQASEADPERINADFAAVQDVVFCILVLQDGSTVVGHADFNDWFNVPNSAEERLDRLKAEAIEVARGNLWRRVVGAINEAARKDRALAAGLKPLLSDVL